MHYGLLLFACVLKYVLMLQMEDFLYRGIFGQDGIDEVEEEHQRQVGSSMMFDCVRVIATILIQPCLPCSPRSTSRSISSKAAEAGFWRTLTMMQMLQQRAC